jgi:hypothetical protein
MDSSNSGCQQPWTQRLRSAMVPYHPTVVHQTIKEHLVDNNNCANVSWDKGDICQESASNGAIEPMQCGLLLQSAVHYHGDSAENAANFMSVCARVSLVVHGLNADDMPKSGVVIHYGLAVPSLSCSLCKEQSGAFDKISISGWIQHRNSIRHKSCNLRSIRALCPATPPPPHGFGDISEVKEYFDGLSTSHGPTYARCMRIAFLVYNQMETYVVGKGFKGFIEHSKMEFEAGKQAVALCEEGTIEIWKDVADWFDNLDAHTRSGRKGGRKTTGAKRPRSQLPIHSKAEIDADEEAETDEKEDDEDNENDAEKKKLKKTPHA